MAHIGLIICGEQPCSTMPCAITPLLLALPVHTDPHYPADFHSWILYASRSLNIRSLIQEHANINLKFVRSDPFGIDSQSLTKSIWDKNPQKKQYPLS